MSSLRKTSLVAGVFYLLTFVSIPTLALYSSVRGPNYILGAGPDTPVIFGAILEALAAQYYWTFLFGQSFIPAVNAVLLGSLLYRSRLVPRVLPALGFFGAALLVAAWAATLFGLLGPLTPASAVAAIPIALWEFSLGIYLVFWGFKPSPITAGM